ncbi:MAG TPA: hypothetical protein VFO68_02105 [Actinophytocola sp.]|nr:hypothetical protein [Actinophytocola sp.]
MLSTPGTAATRVSNSSTALYGVGTATAPGSWIITVATVVAVI